MAPTIYLCLNPGNILINWNEKMQLKWVEKAKYGFYQVQLFVLPTLQVNIFRTMIVSNVQPAKFQSLYSRVIIQRIYNPISEYNHRNLGKLCFVFIKIYRIPKHIWCSCCTDLLIKMVINLTRQYVYLINQW